MYIGIKMTAGHQSVISIIIPIYNESKKIEQNLAVWQSRASCTGVELIFVDGGSTDHGPQKLLDAGLRCVTSDVGRAKQMNVGAQLAQGHILWFVHLDTHFDFFERQRQWHQKMIKECVDFRQYWGFFLVHITGEKTSWSQKNMLGLVSWFINCRSRMTSVSTGDQCQFFSKEFFLTVGGFPDQPLLEDVQISKNAKKLSRPKVGPFGIETSGRRWLTQGIWRTIFQMWTIRYQYWRGACPQRLANEYRQVR